MAREAEIIRYYERWFGSHIGAYADKTNAGSCPVAPQTTTRLTRARYVLHKGHRLAWFKRGVGNIYL